jgi:hypothetical protein
MQQLDAVFHEEPVESSLTVPMDMCSVDIHRSIVHATALVVEQVLRRDGVDPRGLVVSVSESTSTFGDPVHKITARAPTYRVPVLVPQTGL